MRSPTRGLFLVLVAGGGLTSALIYGQGTATQKAKVPPAVVRPLASISQKPGAPVARPKISPATIAAPNANAVSGQAAAYTPSTTNTGFASPYTASADAETAAAQRQANQAAFESGQRTGATLLTQQNIGGRLVMVEASLQRAGHPKKYSAIATHVDVEDPFAEEKKANPLEQVLAGTALQFDAERGIAKVGLNPQSTGCLNGNFKAGDYPLLSDGNLIDTPERMTQFMSECKNSREVQVIRGNNEVVSLP